MDDVYVDMGQEGFYVNLPCIIAPDKTIITGNTYILAMSNKQTSNSFLQVKLVDVYYLQDNHSINLIVKGVENNSNVQLCYNLNAKATKPINWKLIDWKYLCEKIEDEIIKDYCGCKKSIAKDDDLLDFE